MTRCRRCGVEIEENAGIWWTAGGCGMHCDSAYLYEHEPATLSLDAALDLLS